MKIFALYTMARLGLFAGVYGVIWLIFGRNIEWNALSGLYTALFAMIISSLIAFAVLKSLRADLAAEIERRATRAKSAFDAKRAAEDDD